MPAAHCKNCNQPLDGNFCKHCGQSAKTGRINFQFLWDEIQDKILNYDKGIVNTSKELFVRSGHSIREYIAGKRITHIKPIASVFILIGILSILYNHFHINTFNTSAWNDFAAGFNGEPGELKIDIQALNEFKNNNFELVELFYLPLYAFASYLVFKKYKYNYVEHLVLNAFLTAQKLIITLLLFPFFYIYNNVPEKIDWVVGIDSALGVVIVARGYITFFSKDKKIGVIFKTLLVYLFLGVEVFIVFALITFVSGIFIAGGHR
jgi:hypothetical protein